MTENSKQPKQPLFGQQNNNGNIVGYLTAGSLFKKDRKFTFQKNQKNLNFPQQQKISHRLTFNSEKVQAKYSQKPYLTERVKKNNNYFDDSFKITEFTKAQNSLFRQNNFQMSNQKDDSLSKYQHKIVAQPNLKHYNNDRTKEYFSDNFQFSHHKKYQKSPQKKQKIAEDLQTSRRRYFSSCREQAEKYLSILQAQLKQSESNIRKVQNQVRVQIKQDVNEKGLQLKQLMMKMIEEFIEQWKLNQIQYYRVNQMKFLGDTKQLLAQIQQRKILLQQFNVKLQLQQEQNWKKVTAQLLYFDYDTSIKQIHKMSEAILNTVHQKYTLAMSLKLNTQKQLKGQTFKFEDLQQAKNQLIKIFIIKNNKQSSNLSSSSPNKPKEGEIHDEKQEKNLNVSFGNIIEQKI